jgi:hypothetical protein
VPNIVCIGKLFFCKIGMTNGPHISVSYCDIICIKSICNCRVLYITYDVTGVLFIVYFLLYGPMSIATVLYQS